MLPDERINADFQRRVVLDTHAMSWVPSPQPGVERRMLDRIGGEIAQATSLVRYAPNSVFPRHQHARGEEFLVLDGVFSDEHGDYAAGAYVRNPPGSEHVPRSVPGCTILVKLRQMPAGEQQAVAIDTASGRWEQCAASGHEQQTLYASQITGERVTLERLAAGTDLVQDSCAGGEELFILAGVLEDENASYGAGTWIRNPAGYRRRYRSTQGVTFWCKRGHLPPAGQPL